MRLFVALEIPDEIRSRIQRFVDGVSGFAPVARWIAPESLHITLKFIGEQPENSLDKIREVLLPIESKTFDVTLRDCGFFPNPKLPRIFWIGIIAGSELATLADEVDKALLPLKIPPDNHPFNPHITLARTPASRARSRGKTNHSEFERLQSKLTSLSTPEFGTMTAREFFLYQSRPSPQGSCYTKIASFELR